jgi:hypothetical protein
MAQTMFSLLVLSFYVLTSSTYATAGGAGHGFIGYGIDMYDPECAYSCRDALSSSVLNCST